MTCRTKLTQISRRRGFTLLEVMMATAIFAIGMIAVAAIFPSAIMLQKQTIDQFLSEQVAMNVKALLHGRPFLPSRLLSATGADTDQMVHRFKPGPSSYVDMWSMRDRAFPVTSYDSNRATFYWVPLFRDSDPTVDNHNWQVFVFILKREDMREYLKPASEYNSFANPGDPITVPGVKITTATKYTNRQIKVGTDAEGIRIGEWLLDNNGHIYQVSDVDRNNRRIITLNSVVIESPNALTELWYAPPAQSHTIREQENSQSPCQGIVIVTNAIRPS